MFWEAWKAHSGIRLIPQYRIGKYRVDFAHPADKKEGYPQHYCKRKVTVRLNDESRVSALVYIAHPEKVKEGLKPTKDYLNHLLAGRDLLPKEYCQKLALIETIDCP